MTDKVPVNVDVSAPAAQLGRYVATIVRNLAFVCLATAKFVSIPTHATESPEVLTFYPPVSLSDVVKSVAEHQNALKASEFFVFVSVQFGTRAEWANACAWLKAQTERVGAYYVPSQNASTETRYFCHVSKTRNEISLEWFAEFHSLIEDFVNQFGGAQHPWKFDFRDYSKDGDKPHNNKLERTGDR